MSVLYLAEAFGLGENSEQNTLWVYIRFASWHHNEHSSLIYCFD